MFSSVPKTKTSPLKSFVASYTETNAFADTGATLSVPNLWYYAVALRYNNGNTNGRTDWKILEGATNKYEEVSTTSTQVSSSPVLQNTSGSTQTVKVQAKDSANLSSQILNLCLVASPTYILRNDGTGYCSIPLSCYITDVEFFLASGTNLQNPNTSIICAEGFGNNAALATDTSSISLSGINTFVNNIQFLINIGDHHSFIAFDWAGKYLT